MNFMKNNYLLVHGSFGSPFSNQIPWLRNELEKENLEVYTPDFPTGVGYQNYDNWSKLLKVYVEAGIINDNTFIYAHSIAPIFICKFLVENKIKVKRLIFVCGFNNYLGINEEYDSVNESMYFNNLEDIENYCDEIICYYSDNDPYVKYDVEKEFADTISTEQYCIHNGGHLNAESNYTEFKELLNHKQEVKYMLLINCSNREQNCFTILNNIKSNEDKLISLANKRMEFCLGCERCKNKLEKYCVLNDFITNNIYEEIIKEDTIILASPMYMSNINGILKNLLDRFYPLYNHELLRGKKIYLILTGYTTKEDNEEEINSIIEYFNGISEWLYIQFEFLDYFRDSEEEEVKVANDKKIDLIKQKLNS